MAELLTLTIADSEQLAVLNRKRMWEEGDETNLSQQEQQQQMVKWLQDNEFRFLGMKENDQLQAYIMFRIEDHAYIRHFFVDPKHRRKGLATYLLKKVIKEAGQRELRMEVPIHNTAAQNFYNSLGWKPFSLTYRMKVPKDS